MWRVSFALPFLAACASHVLIPPEQVASLERELTGKERDRYLKLSYYVTPFFGDASKKLLAPVPPEHVRLLNHPDGTPVNPGRIEKVLPAGAKARILKLELPTAWVVTERVPYTPRTQPWVYLAVEGENRELPFILVLRPQIKSDQEFRAELDRYLALEDPSPLVESFGEMVRQGVRTKQALVDMPALALEMAWGYPERKRITFQDSLKKEEWLYGDGTRLALLVDGRVASLKE